MTGLQRLTYHVAEDPERPGASRPARTFRGPGEPADVPIGPFNSDEAAARFFLERLLQRDGRPSMRSASEPGEPGTVPGMVLSSQQELPVTGSRLVRFTQTSRTIPVFGGQAVVELDRDRALVSAEVRLGDVPDVGTSPTLQAAEAVGRISAATAIQVEPSDLRQPPTLEYFHDDAAGTWHLAWHVRGVPGLPAEAEAEEGHGIGVGFRRRHALADYLVDAHSGELLSYFSTTPTLGIPVRLAGIDEDNVNVEFYGSRVPAPNEFELSDPLRHVRTYDLGHGDIDSASVPVAPVWHPAGAFGEPYRAAVTAHRHGALVQDFYRSVCQRNGIDDLGMELVSIVNCSCAADEPPPVWTNACWWNQRMWFGQVRVGERLVSLARHLDVFAHEITHGVIETSSNLLYRDQSGALNESFADIMGVIVANWYQAPEPEDTSTWEWGIGKGLGSDGKPLRDLADPASLGHPAHMRDYWVTTRDSGGVHRNSNIHNVAVHHLLTAVGDDHSPVISVRDAALLVYLTFVQLTTMATFADARQKMVEVANVYFSADQSRLDAAVAAIGAAYGAVGIGLP